MSGFAVIGGTPAETEAPIENDGWFPDIDPAAFADWLRLRDSITPDRRRDALVAAIITVGNDLRAWAAVRAAAGHASLADVPSPKVDGASRLVTLYTRAVFCNAKAELIERYRDVDLTGNGQRKVEDLEPAPGELRRDATYAIRDILGVGRVAVELI